MFSCKVHPSSMRTRHSRISLTLSQAGLGSSKYPRTRHRNRDSGRWLPRGAFSDFVGSATLLAHDAAEAVSYSGLLRNMVVNAGAATLAVEAKTVAIAEGETPRAGGASAPHLMAFAPGGFRDHARWETADSATTV